MPKHIVLCSKHRNFVKMIEVTITSIRIDIKALGLRSRYLEMSGTVSSARNKCCTSLGPSIENSI